MVAASSPSSRQPAARRAIVRSIAWARAWPHWPGPCRTPSCATPCSPCTRPESGSTGTAAGRATRTGHVGAAGGASHIGLGRPGLALGRFLDLRRRRGLGLLDQHLRQPRRQRRRRGTIGRGDRQPGHHQRHRGADDKHVAQDALEAGFVLRVDRPGQRGDAELDRGGGAGAAGLIQVLAWAR